MLGAPHLDPNSRCNSGTAAGRGIWHLRPTRTRPLHAELAISLQRKVGTQPPFWTTDSTAVTVHTQTACNTCIYVHNNWTAQQQRIPLQVTPTLRQTSHMYCSTLPCLAQVVGLHCRNPLPLSFLPPYQVSSKPSLHLRTRQTEQDKRSCQHQPNVPLLAFPLRHYPWRTLRSLG